MEAMTSGASVRAWVRDECRGLGFVQTQQVAAHDREVPEQLGHHPGQRKVPAAEQQQPHGLGRCVEAFVDHPERRGGQLVRVVHDHEAGAGRGRVEEGRQSLGVPAAVCLDPDGVVAPLVGPGRLGDPAGHPERLAGPRGRDEQGQRPVDAVVQRSPQPGARHVGLGEPGCAVRVPRSSHAPDLRFRRRASSGLGRLRRCGGIAGLMGKALRRCIPATEQSRNSPRASSPSEPGHHAQLGPGRRRTSGGGPILRPAVEATRRGRRELTRRRVTTG